MLSVTRCNVIAICHASFPFIDTSIIQSSGRMIVALLIDAPVRIHTCRCILICIYVCCTYIYTDIHIFVHTYIQFHDREFSCLFGTCFSLIETRASRLETKLHFLCFKGHDRFFFLFFFYIDLLRNRSSERKNSSIFWLLKRSFENINKSMYIHWTSIVMFLISTWKWAIILIEKMTRHHLNRTPRQKK